MEKHIKYKRFDGKFDWVDFGVTPEYYIVLNSFKYIDSKRKLNIEIPKLYKFDGVTTKAPFTFMFSNNDLRKGVRAACIHDWICENKHNFTRKESTEILVEQWVKDGLGDMFWTRWKPSVVYWSVFLFQCFKKRWKNT